MSSSRSVAAARNRRAGDNNVQPSIKPQMQAPQKNARFVPSGQGAMIPPSAIPQNGGQNQPQPNRRPYYQQPTIPVKSPGVNGPVGQVSISDAFALVTIRLGKVEQFIQQLQEEGLQGIGVVQDTSSLNNDQQFNSSFVSKEELQTLYEQLKNIEQKVESIPQSVPEPSYVEEMKIKINQLEEKYNLLDNEMIGMKDMLQTMSEKEIRDLKDMLLTMSMKNEKNVMETCVLLQKIQKNVTEMENKLQPLNEKQTSLEEQILLLSSRGIVEENIDENVLENTQETQTLQDEEVEVLENVVESVES